MSNHDETRDDWHPTDDELQELIPINEADPALLHAHEQGTLRGPGRPPIADKKQVVSLRLKPDVIDALRATGKGWQTRLSNQIEEWVSD